MATMTRLSKPMEADAIRNWMGLYILCLTVFLGGYLFLVPDVLLPLEQGDKTACFQIILPFLLAQVAVVYRYYSFPSNKTPSPVPVPVWAIKGPPILVTILLIISFVQFGTAGLMRLPPPSAETFKGLVTFCVALLNASSVFILSRFFEALTEEAGETKPKSDPS